MVVNSKEIPLMTSTINVTSGTNFIYNFYYVCYVFKSHCKMVYANLSFLATFSPSTAIKISYAVAQKYNINLIKVG